MIAGTILNPARSDLGDRARADLGDRFVTVRNAQIDEDCGRIANVRAIVTAAREEGLLDEDEEEDPAE